MAQEQSDQPSAQPVQAPGAVLSGGSGASASSPGPRRQVNWPMVTSLVTALTALAALVFTGLSLTANRAQVEVAQQGLITDRYTSAVGQLGTIGADRVQVRLGGIYALERLAQDSRRDRDTIMDVLAAFVRSSSPRTAAACPGTVPVDIQAAFTVLARRSAPVRKYEVIDLRHTCLRGLDGERTHLSALTFVGADLTGADFYGARMELVSFAGADLAGASFEEAVANPFLVLKGCDLTGANLKSADLRGVDFQDAILNGADLSDAQLGGADLASVTQHGGATVIGARTDGQTRGTWW
jgi:Pentapeptide repeats (8 copies)